MNSNQRDMNDINKNLKLRPKESFIQPSPLLLKSPETLKATFQKFDENDINFKLETVTEEKHRITRVKSKSNKKSILMKLREKDLSTSTLLG